MPKQQYFPRSAAVTATQLTADKATFVLNFNHGRTNYPCAIDNGNAIFVVPGPGIATEMKVGDWVIERADGVEVHNNDDFRQRFCLATS